MVLGFVLITAKSGKQYNVCTQLFAIPELVELYPLAEDATLLAKIRTEDLYELGRIVMYKIRQIDDVICTKTLPTFLPYT